MDKWNYCYYNQFSPPKRSQPLINSYLTVLVVGGVQWLRSSHLRTIREVLDR